MLKASLNETLRNITYIIRVHGGTRWRDWLRHYVTSRKVAGSIPD
jgi:hypothetical protein